MRELKRRHRLVPLAALLMFVAAAVWAFVAYDRALSRDLHRLGIAVKNPPGIALEDWLK